MQNDKEYVVLIFPFQYLIWFRFVRLGLLSPFRTPAIFADLPLAVAIERHFAKMT